MYKIFSKIDYRKIILSLLATQAAGLAGSLVTVQSVREWYPMLNKPFFNPPDWLFAPVWTLLYLLMGISLYLVWINKGKLKWFWVQLVLNVLWSYLFFGLKSPALALVGIIFLWIAILRTIKDFLKTDHRAGFLLYPYIAWVSFAMILNFSIWMLN
jgi:translocator protein